MLSAVLSQQLKKHMEHDCSNSQSAYIINTNNDSSSIYYMNRTIKRVLVLDANQRSALAVTRSLGKKGIEILTAEETPTALASSSKYSRQHFTYPSPGVNPGQFIDYLCTLTKEQHIDILLPMTELTTELLIMHKTSFSNAALPFPDIGTVESLANKCLLLQTAASLDIPVPLSWHVDNPDNIPCKLDDLPYPIVLKPGKSWLFNDGKWSRAAVRFADNPSDAMHILASDWAFRAHPFMIQENIAGHGAGVFAIYNKGTPLTLFAHRRLREKPPSGGVSVLSTSIKLDPELGSIAKKLLGNANWHGAAMVEFKVTPDGKPYLMEVNTRFWGSLQLAIDAGVDFPYMLYQLACGEHPDPVIDYKTGKRLRWLLGDLDSLYLTLRDKHYSIPHKIHCVIDFLTPSPLRTRHEVNRLGDMNPFWYECKHYIRDILK